MNGVQGDTTARKGKRRPWQFSLRLMFLAITLCALVLGLRMWRVRHREEAIDAVRKLGGSVLLGSEPPAPQWARRLVFPSVIVVNLEGTPATGADLARLKGLKTLQTLKLGNTKIAAGGLKHLAGLVELESLSLAETAVTDADLVHLNRLRNLTKLDLSGTRVTDSGLKHLEGLTQLEVLALHDTKVTDAGLQHLRGLTRLRHLRLEESQITPAGVKHVKALTSLQTMVIHVPNGTGKQAWGLLRSLPNVQSAGILRPGESPIWQGSSRWEVTPAGVAEAILSRVHLEPKEAATLLEVLADTRNRDMWGRPAPDLSPPVPPPVEEDPIGSVEEFIQAVEEGWQLPINFLRTWAYSRSAAAKEAIPALLELLEDPDYEVRRLAAFILVRIGLDNEQVAAALARMLKDDDPQLRAIAAYTFNDTDFAYAYGDIGPRICPEDAKVAVSLLLGSSQDEHWEVKSAVAEALGGIVQANPEEAEAVLPVLLKMLRDNDRNVVSGAVYGLDRIAQGNPAQARALLPILLDMFRDKNASARQAAWNTLGRIVDSNPQEATAIVPALLSMLQEKDKWIRSAGIDVLGRVAAGNREEATTIVPALFRMLEDEDDSIRSVATRAFARIAQGICLEAAEGSRPP